MTADEQAIRNLVTLWHSATAAGDVDTVLGLIAEDVVFLVSGRPPMRGRGSFESGLRCFIVLRDGQELAQVPKTPVGKYGRPLFQSMTYHDTPSKPLPEMRYVDSSAKAGAKHEYAVIAVNSVGLKSEPSPKFVVGNAK